MSSCCSGCGRDSSGFVPLQIQRYNVADPRYMGMLSLSYNDDDDDLCLVVSGGDIVWNGCDFFLGENNQMSSK